MTTRTTLRRGTMLVAALLAAGCSAAPAPSPPGGGAAPADPSVQWASRVCDAITPAGTLGTKISGVDGSSPAALATALDTAGVALTASSTALAAVGASPMPDTEEIVASVRRTLGTTATGVAEARAKLLAGDTTATAGALTTLTTGLDSLTRITDAPSGSPLALATAQAPSCRALTGG